MECNAVFEGGGIRGIGIVGALVCLEKEGYTWRNLAGTSSGGIIAALLAAGYNAKEIYSIICKTDFLNFLDKNSRGNIPVLGTVFSVIKENGIYSGDYFEKWIYNLLKAKGVIKFKDLCKDGENRLRIIATDITRKKTIILPEDLQDYGIDPMEFRVSKALRMSMSIPLYFKPVKLKYKDMISYIVDGGVSLNYPITIFDKDDNPKVPILGLKFKKYRPSLTSEGKTNPIAFLFDIANTYTSRDSDEDLNKGDKKRTIFIPSMEVQITDFSISKQKSIELFKAGYIAASKFIGEMKIVEKGVDYF